MPKEKEPASRSKVRIFYAEIDGNDDAVEALVQAFGRATQSQTRVVKTVAIAKPIAPNSDDSRDAESIEDFDEATEPEEDESTPSSGATRNQKPRKKPTYQFVSSLDLRPNGKPSLRSFYEEKAPSDSQSQTALFVYYLKKILNCGNVGADHLYTAFKDVGVRSPTDILQVARNTAFRKGWIDASEGSNLRITVSGENYIEHDLPAKSKAK